MTEFLSAISNFGFPVAVASYLLFRFEKKLDGLNETNNSLVTQIADLKIKIISLSKIIKKSNK